MIRKYLEKIFLALNYRGKNISCKAQLPTSIYTQQSLHKTNKTWRLFLNKFYEELFIWNENWYNKFTAVRNLILHPHKNFYIHITFSEKKFQIIYFFVCLFGFFCPTGEFFTRMETSPVKGYILTYARHLWPLSSEVL